MLLFSCREARSCEHIDCICDEDPTDPSNWLPEKPTMFSKLYIQIRGSKLLQAGSVLVVMGLTTEALEALGTVDLSSLPYVGPHAAAILAGVGVAKILLRLAIGLVAAYTAKPETPAQ